VIIIENKINILYPTTTYFKLNNVIQDSISNITNKFLDYSKENLEMSTNYSLNITYESYTYGNYISYVFFISMYTGGAHPNNKIFTINFNILENKIINIDDIIKSQFTLEFLSKESRKLLGEDKNIGKDKNSIEMLINGTKPDKLNFRNFAFSKEGLVLYFEQYQVAPYSSGIFKVTIPYNNTIRFNIDKLF